MIKVSVFYPADPGKRFDHEYYRTRHMPLVKARLGAACISYEVDKGIVGGKPNVPPTFIAMCHIFSESIEVFQAAFEPHVGEIFGNIANYTNIEPIMQISEVVVK